MSSTVKHFSIGCLVMITVTSCSALKRSGGSAQQPARNSGVTSNGHTSPRFIENISIKGGEGSVINSPTVNSAYAPSLLTGFSDMTLASPLAFKYAILLDVPVEEINDAKLFDFIESWYGTRYRYGGNDKSGIDCSAFAQTFLSYNYDQSVPRTSISQYESSKRIGKEELQEGDLVFFKTMGKRRTVSHVGIYLRNNKFVHASTSLGVTINDIDDPYYASTYAGAGRIK